jgi:putative membrane protein
MKKLVPLVVIPAVLLLCAAPTGAAAPRLASWDRAYVLSSAQGIKFEIDMSRIAMRHARTRSARRLAGTLFRDHGHEQQALRKLAGALRVKLPKSPTIQQRHEIAGVTAHEGSTAFDRAFVRLEVSDHIMDVSENDAEQIEGRTAAVKDFSAHFLPMYRGHLWLARLAAKRLNVYGK